MKKLLFILLAAILPVMASAYDVYIDGIYYNINKVEKTATVTYSSSTMSNGRPYNKTTYSGDVIIPETIIYEEMHYRVTNIGDMAFCGCFGLTSISIPNSVTNIGSSSFQGCGLTVVTIPSSVVSIDSQAFYDCSNLLSVTIPNSTTSIGSHAFTGTAWYDNQQDGMVYAGNVAYKFKGTMPNNAIVVLKEGIVGIAGGAFWNCTNLAKITIPNGVTTIGGGAFNGCTNLTSVTIPDGLKTICGEAFSGCSNLASINIPNSVTTIGSSAFMGTAWYNNQPDGMVYAGNVAYKYKGTMPANTSIELKDGITSISGGAFYNCSGLVSVAIPNSIIYIGPAFGGCSGLQSVHISDLAAWCNITFVGTSSQPLQYAHHLFENGKEVTNLIIPESVTSIGSHAFRDCSSITSVTIPNSVTHIGSGSFSGCTSISSVSIPNSVTTINNSAFFKCSGLTSIDIPNSVTTIGMDAFAYCDNLSSISIPTSVEFMGERAFIDCSSLISVTIGNGLKTIEEYSFWGSSSLCYITIGSSVKTIKSGAFLGSINLADVYCHAKDVPKTYNFSEKSFPSSINNATLHVPSTSIDNYKSSDYPWTSFKEIVEMGNNTFIERCASPTISYINGKLVFNCETDGVEFVSEIKNADIKKQYDKEVSLTPTYEITVYATKAGYEDSDVATATIRWRDGHPLFEGFSSVVVNQQEASDTNGDATVDVADIATIISVMAAAARKDIGSESDNQ